MKIQKEKIKKLLSEIENIVEKFDFCRNVGYVVEPLLIKLAKECGLKNYDIAYNAWVNNGVDYMVGKKIKKKPKYGLLLLGWQGEAIKISKDVIYIGIENTIKKIKEVII